MCIRECLKQGVDCQAFKSTVVVMTDFCRSHVYVSVNRLLPCNSHSCALQNDFNATIRTRLGNYSLLVSISPWLDQLLETLFHNSTVRAILTNDRSVEQIEM